MRRIYLILLVVLCLNMLKAQTHEELVAAKVEKEAELTTLQPQLDDLSGRVEALKTEIAMLTDLTAPYPRWDIGVLGNVGVNFSNFSNWLSKSGPNTSAVNIGFSLNGFANLQQRKYFWRNGGNLTLGWIKFDDKDDPDDSKDFNVAADAFNISSLFGYKLSEKLAISALGEYRTSVLEDRLNNPGYLDLGAGGTWTPVTDLVVVVHPLNYNFIFSDGAYDYESSLGCKIMADYKRELAKGVAWKSNLSMFMSYGGSDLSNWTWVNGLTTAVKGIGIGLDIGLRGNKQEALAADLSDNPLQSYWILGLSFAL